MAGEFWLASYVLGLFGSVSFGYLILRFGLPDIRTAPDQLKFGLSGFLGVGIFALSYISSLALSPIFLWTLLSGLTLLAIVLITAKNHLVVPKSVKVAVPVVRLGAPTAVTSREVTTEVELERPKVIEKRVFRERKRKRSEKIPTEKAEIIEKPEVLPEAEKKEEERIRARGRYRRELEEERGIVTAGEPRPAMVSKRGFMKARRERYLQRRGELVEEVKTDLLKRAIGKPQVISPELEEQAKEGEELGEGLDLSDLENIGSLEELSEASDVSLEDLGELDLESLGGLSETQKIPKEKGMGCPKCNSLKGTIVYCPYCGKGFCSDCSEKVRREGDMVFYGCPHCKKEVIVKEKEEKKD